MKTYYSSKNILFTSLLWLIASVFFFFPFIFKIIAIEEVPVAIQIFFAALAGLFVWIVLDTNYLIEEKNLHYHSGPIRGKIDIHQIHKIEHVKTFFVSSLLKPALGSYGLTLKYNKFDDIYISPKNKEEFIAELLKINPGIQIIN